MSPLRLRLALVLALVAAGPARAAAAPDATAAFDVAVARAKAAMMADPAAALAPVARAEALAATLPPARRGEATATALWLRGEALTRLNHPDQALPVLKRADALASAPGVAAKLHADVVFAKGTAEAGVGQVSAALGDFQQAYRDFVAIADSRGQAKALLSIGGIFSDAGDNERSLTYYAQVPEIYRGDPAIDLAAHNNLGETFKKLGRYREAEPEYRTALAAARALGSPMLEASILPNLASAQLQRGDLAGAEATATSALRITRSGEAPFVWGVRAQIALRRGDLAAASAYLDRTFANADLDHTALPFRDFHETAYRVYAQQGRYELAMRHLAAFKRLDDQARALTASGSAALMSARFDFANQNLRITRLKAEQVRQDAQLAESKARMRTVVLGILLAAGGVTVALLLVAIVSIVRSRNRERAANAELQTANASLEKALRVKTEFLATTSHEIRTPLNGILGMTQVLLADRTLAAAVRERVAVVQGAGETMRALVDDILDMAKIETGHMTVAPAPMDLHRLLSDAARLWQGQADAKRLRFVAELDQCPDWIEADENRLRQIVFNLMGNALKFTEAGQVTLSARVRTEHGAERLEIAVADTGIGIAASQQALIFDSFRQVDGGTTRRYGGTGLGLAICRNLARAMGGDVAVESRPGEGSTFTLHLPLCRATAVEPAAGDAPVAQGRAETLDNARVLLVEGNPLTQRVLAGLIEPAVARLDAVADGEAALSALRTGGFDHLIADAGAVSGMAEELRAALDRAGARLSVLHTADASPAGLAALGADQLIARPIAAQALLGRLREVYAPEPTVVAA